MECLNAQGIISPKSFLNNFILSCYMLYLEENLINFSCSHHLTAETDSFAGIMPSCRVNKKKNVYL